MKRGIIIVNGYFENQATKHQVDSLIKEFALLDTKIEVLKSNTILAYIENGKVKVNLKKADFIVFLDKDVILASLLEKAGYKLFNSAETIRLCDDKMLTYTYLTEKGINMPTTISSPLMYSDNSDKEFLDKVESILGLPLIVKKVYGSMGAGVFEASTKNDLNELFEKLKRFPHLYQKKVGENGVDTRVIVIGKKAVASMKRVNENSFKSNIEAGGKGIATTLTSEEKAFAEKVATLLNADYLGVDILNEDGKPCLCEANSNAFFKGITEVTNVNVAKLYAEYIIKETYFNKNN